MGLSSFFFQDLDLYWNVLNSSKTKLISPNFLVQCALARFRTKFRNTSIKPGPLRALQNAVPDLDLSGS